HKYSIKYDKRSCCCIYYASGSVLNAASSTFSNLINQFSSGFSEFKIVGSSSALVLRSTILPAKGDRSEEHTSELQSRFDLVCRLLLEKKKNKNSSTVLSADTLIMMILL